MLADREFLLDLKVTTIQFQKIRVHYGQHPTTSGFCSLVRQGACISSLIEPSIVSSIPNISQCIMASLTKLAQHTYTNPIYLTPIPIFKYIYSGAQLRGLHHQHGPSSLAYASQGSWWQSGVLVRIDDIRLWYSESRKMMFFRQQQARYRTYISWI